MAHRLPPAVEREETDSRVERLLEAALDESSSERELFLERACGEDRHLLLRLRHLLELAESDGFLDRPALREGAPPKARRCDDTGARVGAFRLSQRIGAGGMGDVYLAERVEGGFRQRVALKIARLDSDVSPARLDAERRILAGLDHPGIARLYDGGVMPDGRAYIAMELVEGQELLAFCASQRAPLETRLELFREVCEAVTFAHEHLVVHRDLKPANVLVTSEGRVKLLDFGIAKLLAAGNPADATVTQGLQATPAYAAPEQLVGGAVTTATDVYALGATLFELLSGRLPIPLRPGSLAAAVQRLTTEAVPRMSDVAEGPVAARRLRGDLDAIVAKALRREPEARYPDARSLGADVARHLAGEPVEARSGARAYVARRFLRRNWLPISAAAAVFLALVAGLLGVSWQKRRAEREAARATATKDFLLGVFRASDPRVASDKPRGQITARELLDIGSARIGKDFAGQPDLQIELLGLSADIYENLEDDERWSAVEEQRMQLARARYGSAHPIVIEGLLAEADAACFRQDYAKASRLLAEADASLRASSRDRTEQRAQWWRIEARSLATTAGGASERGRALDRSIALFAEVAPRSSGFASALSMAARLATDRGEHLRAKELAERALAVAESSTDRNEILIADDVNNLARKLERVGDYARADSAYTRAETLFARTSGRISTYWITRAYHARMLHMRGDPGRALAIFRETLPTIPADWKTNTNDEWFREVYGERLSAGGLAAQAIPLLEHAHRTYLSRPQYEYDVREVRRELSDAYDRTGRTAEARTMLKASRDDYVAKEAADSEFTLRVRERWARFLLDHAQRGEPDLAAAEAEARDVIARIASRPLEALALAHADLSRIACTRAEARAALAESRLALAALERLNGLYDLRIEPDVWLAHSAALLAGGDRAGARAWAGKALDASRRYDAPASASILRAEAAVRAAAGSP
jgi:serine/threonine-protein kinase